MDIGLENDVYNIFYTLGQHFGLYSFQFLNLKMSSQFWKLVHSFELKILHSLHHILGGLNGIYSENRLYGGHILAT